VKRSPMPARKTTLGRTKRVAPRNQTRSKKAHARNYGEEAATIRLMPCLGEGRGLARCMGPIHVAHVTARGRGGCKGGRFDQVPLCAAHHRLAGEAGTSDRAMFEKLHSLDLRAEADRIALLHSEPLGLRAVARAWVLEQYDREHYLHAAVLEHLDAYERDALFGWVRRAMGRSAAGKAARALGQRPDQVRGAILLDLGALPLSINELGALAEAAGWPS
jgi:hypothetical protein